jgi:hypothetical protein
MLNLSMGVLHARYLRHHATERRGSPHNAGAASSKRFTGKLALEKRQPVVASFTS